MSEEPVSVKGQHLVRSASGLRLDVWPTWEIVKL